MEYISNNPVDMRLLYFLLDTSDKNRGIGRSTAMAETYIRLMLTNMDNWYTIRDHHPEGDKHLFNQVITMLNNRRITVENQELKIQYITDKTAIKIIGFIK